MKYSNKSLTILMFTLKITTYLQYLTALENKSQGCLISLPQNCQCASCLDGSRSSNPNVGVVLYP